MITLTRIQLHLNPYNYVLCASAEGGTWCFENS